MSSFSVAMPGREGWRADARRFLIESPDVLGRKFPGHEKGALVVFLRPGCPLANLYSGRLNEFQAHYSPKGIQVYAVLVTENTEALPDWVRQRNLKFKVIADRNTLVDHFEPAASPEAFLLDEKNELVYRGSIDDQYEPGRPHFPKPEKTPVRDRLERLAAGTPLTPAFTQAKGCVFPLPKVSFNKTIAPLIYSKCAHCHRPGDIQSEIPLTNYNEIREWAPTMVERLNDRYMPPWRAHHLYGEFSNDVSLTVNELYAFTRWVEDGMPVEDNPVSAPNALLDSEWRIGTPDAVVGMLPEGETYGVPKEGLLPYQHFIVANPFERDVWVLATEVRPGAPDVVHHINVFIQTPSSEGALARILKRGGAASRLRARGQKVDNDSLGMVLDLYGYKLEKQIRFLSDFNPAESVTRFPDGKGLLLRKDARIVFEVHYTPNGYAEREDRSRLAFKIAPEIPEDWEAREPITRIGGHLGEIEIEPNGRLQLSIDIPVPLDADLHSLKPHMHYRGKSFRAELLVPKAPARTLLYLPRWDYDFQLPYLFQTPVYMPKGSTLRLHYEWDNSSSNPFISQAQTEKAIAFGFQTEDEMSMAFPTYTYRTNDPAAIRAAEEEVTRAIMRQVRLPALTRKSDVSGEKP